MDIKFGNGRSALQAKDSLWRETSPRLIKCGFTLAEVLITLGVIGVVAAMTLPTLINEHRGSQWETALKRDYTVLSQGFRKIMADYGCDTLECTGIFSGTLDEEGNEVPDQEKLDKAMRSAFQIVKSYKRGEYESRDVKHLKGSQHSNFGNAYYYFTLNDGATVLMDSTASGKCTWLNGIACAYLIIDVNGTVPPNTFGKDVFALGHLINNGVLVPDTSGKWEEYSSNSSQYWRNAPRQCGTPNTKLKDETISQCSGQNCLARIMENNWKMDYLH